MGFYQQISKYYDYIFPASDKAVEFFTKRFIKHKVRSVLDVACGSGNYLQALAEKGYQMTGVDLDLAMVEAAQAKAKANKLNYTVIQGDMQSLDSILFEKFDALICIGNSLVHLIGKEEILKALRGFYSRLHSKGMAIIQIINYDRIIEQNIDALPTIENRKIGLSFVRKYDYRPEEEIVYFNTLLTVPGEKYENSIPLYPLVKDDLISMIEEAGFKSWDLHGGFDEKPWTPSSYATVVVAYK